MCDFIKFGFLIYRWNIVSELVEEYVGVFRELGLRLMCLILNSLGVYLEIYDKYMFKEFVFMWLNYYLLCLDLLKIVGLVFYYDVNFFIILY